MASVLYRKYVDSSDPDALKVFLQAIAQVLDVTFSEPITAYLSQTSANQEDEFFIYDPTNNQVLCHYIGGAKQAT